MIDGLGRTFEAFKKANDERLAQIEKRGSADPLLTAQVEKMSAALSEMDKLKARLDESEAKANRPGATGSADEVEAEHRKAFGSYLRKGEQSALAEIEKKLVSVGVTTDGGYAITKLLDEQILKIEQNANVLRGICKQITVGNESYEQLIDKGGADSGWVGETDARTETNSATLGSFSPAFGEVYAFPFTTQKALDDLFFNVEQWLAEGVGQRFASQEEDAFLNGSGVKKPKGILAYTIKAGPAFGELLQVKSGANGTTTGDKLIDVVHSIKQGYRSGARFVMADLTVAVIRKLKDNQNNYLWKPGLTEGAPSTILGYGVTECEAMPAASSNGHAILFGNFARGYQICDLPQGVRVLRDPYAVKGKVGFYSTKRLGGGLTDSNAIVVHTLSV